MTAVQGVSGKHSREGWAMANEKMIMNIPGYAFCKCSVTFYLYVSLKSISNNQG